MNILTKQRYISTSIWSDDWFDSLSEREKLVYFYLLTNEHTNPAGVYQCTLKNVRLEIGLSRDEIERIMDKFAEAGKAFCYKDYIIIPKWLKHQKIGERNKIFLGAVKVLKSLPDEVKVFISDRRHYDWDVSKIFGNGWPIDSLCQNNDGLSNNSNSLSENEQKNGIAYPQNGANSAHDLDLDVDSDLDIDLDVDLDLAKHPDEQPVENPGPNIPTTTFSHIKKIARVMGFIISDKQARAFLTLESNWFSGDFHFIRFAAEKIQENTDKSQSDLERIFVKSWGYQNLIDEYPAWRTIREKKAAEVIHKHKLEKARANVPKQCPRCGGEVNQKRCESCNGVLVFDNSSLKYITEDGLSEMYRKNLRKKNEVQQNETIDF